MGKRENQKIVVDGFKANEADDVILQKLFEEGGVPFTDLRTVFNDIVKEKGLRLSNKERKIKTDELMEGTTEIKDAESMLKIVAMLETKLKVTTTKAMGSLRTWAKDTGFTLPKAARAPSKRKVGFTGHYEKILDHIVGLRNAHEPSKGNETFSPDKKEVVAFCNANAIPEAYSTTALNVVHFAQVWNGEIVEAVDPEETKSDD